MKIENYIIDGSSHMPTLFLDKIDIVLCYVKKAVSNVVEIDLVLYCLMSTESEGQI